MTFDRRTVLALMITVAFILVLMLLLIHPPTTLDESIKSILLLLLGALVGQVGQVFSFDFGSSDGSKQKDAALIAASETPQMAARRRAEAAPVVMDQVKVNVPAQELEADVTKGEPQ